ncbi:MAG: TRAP transporter large permease subunit [Paracoccus sp. (in: a-proteobacteria)]
MTRTEELEAPKLPELGSTDVIISEVADVRPGSKWMRPIEIIAAALLLAIISLLLIAIVSRFVMQLPFVWVDEAASICFFWLAMLGAAIALDRNEHLRLTVVVSTLPERPAAFVQCLANLAVATMLVALIRPAYQYMISEALIRSVTLGIPNSYRAAAILVGIVLMAAIVLSHTLRRSSPIDVLGAAVVIAVLAGTAWWSGPELAGMGFVDIALLLILPAAACLALGVPIAFCFGLGSIAFLAFSTTFPLVVIVGRMDEGMSSLILISVPIFVLLGCVLDATGMGKAIVDFMASLLGHVKAGLSFVLLVSLFLVSGISGSKVSDMATVAPALFPEMKRRGHKPKEMIALLATGSAMADTVPPSIVLIVLGSVAGVSIAALFSAGLVIAIVLLLALCTLARWKARHETNAGERRASAAVIFKALAVAVPALVLPFVIRGAVTSGFATATEVSTIAVLYAILIGIMFYGGISLRRLYRMFVETAALSGAILLILGTASAMAWALTQTGFATMLATWVTGLPGGWITFMLISILIFVGLGCVLEGLPAIVLMAPIMYPIATSFGINDIHYSMVIVTAMNVGLMAPPIGIGFYIACRIGNVSPDEAMGAIWPYIAALLIGLLVIAAVPAISTAFI